MCENDMLLLDIGDYHCNQYHPYYRSCKLPPLFADGS